MSEHQEVESLSDFMNWVKDTSPAEAEQVRFAFFYRGHADANYTLQPGVYRTDSDGRSHRNDEARMYHEMLRRDPAAFAEDKTVFERLVRMQHHGLPTRLLDLTQSPLVALFFACEGELDKDGQVMFFHMPQRDVLHQESLSELILVGIDCPLSFKTLGFDICKSLKNLLIDENKNNIKKEDFNSEYHMMIVGFIKAIDDSHEKLSDIFIVCVLLKKITGIFFDFYAKWKKYFDGIVPDLVNSNEKIVALEAQVSLEKFINRFARWEHEVIDNLCKQMRIELHENYPHLYDFLNVMLNYNFVFPPMNNERLRRQRGAFLVYSPVKSQLWTVDDFKKPEVVRVKAKAKENILNDLANQGVSRSYLFPELDEQARDIRTLYPLTNE